jgi:hypothetical protein
MRALFFDAGSELSGDLMSCELLAVLDWVDAFAGVARRGAFAMLDGIDALARRRSGRRKSD